MPIIRKETWSIYAFGAEKTTEKTYNIIKVKAEIREQSSLNIEVEAVERAQISAAGLPTHDKYIPKIHNK